MEAELRAIICSGPRRGRQPTTYALVDERIPPTPPRERDDALRDLTVRYFTSHGPALVRDMSWWSGLTITDVRRGIDLAGAALERRPIDDKEYVAAVGGFEPPDLRSPHVLLLSNYDEVAGSYTDYGPVLDPAHDPPNWTFDAVGPHVLMRDGLVAGGWRRGLERSRVKVTVSAFVPLRRAERAALDEEADRFGSFFDLPVELAVTFA